MEVVHWIRILKHDQAILRTHRHLKVADRPKSYLLFIDLKKAFDRVRRDILMQKL